MLVPTDMENLFQLLDKQGKVRDAPDAKALVLSEGRVAFDDVTFGYEAGAIVLKNVSGWGVDSWCGDATENDLGMLFLAFVDENHTQSF